MYTKVCSICGKTFETNYHNQTLCTLPHPKQCLNCGSTFYVRGADKGKEYCCENCKIALYSKRCILCGKLFIPKNSVQVTCGDRHYNTCIICGNKFEVFPKTKDRKTCSRQCAAAYRVKTGVSKQVSIKAQNTCKQRYGNKQYNVSKNYKVCKECGRKFKPTSNRQQWCNDAHYRPCPICGTPVLVTYYKNKNVTCSDACRVKLIAKTCTDRYGKDNYSKTDEFKTKAANTCVEKYGVSHYSKTSEYKEKFKQTSLQRYGTEHPMQSSLVQAHAIKTNRQKYNSNWYMGTKSFVEASINSSMARYGVPWASQTAQAKQKRKNTNIQKYGSEFATRNKAVRERTEQTNLERYGVRVTSQNSKVKQKAVQTSLMHFGVEYPSQSDTVRQKVIQTNIRKYGVTNVMFNDSIKQKQQRNATQAIKRKYGVDYPFQSTEVFKHMWVNNIHKYGIPYCCLLSQCQSAGRAISKVNKQFKDMLCGYGINCELEKHIGYKSYDVFVKEAHTLIEINPSYTHNSYCSFYGKQQGIASRYHIDKTLLAEQNGYRCIHVWDWDSWDKIAQLLVPCVKVYAREGQVVKLSSSRCNQFLNQYHLQGTCKGQKACYVLVKDNDILEVMTFGQPRYNKNFEWEMLRLCTKSGVSVVGGAERMFAHFVKEYSPNSVVSYCDRSKFTGRVYEKLGFKLESAGKPTKHWYSSRKSEKMQHVTDSFLRQRGFDQIFGTSYGKGTSNEQLMIGRGYLPVYDCGQMRFAWHEIV